MTKTQTNPTPAGMTGNVSKSRDYNPGFAKDRYGQPVCPKCWSDSVYYNKCEHCGYMGVE